MLFTRETIERLRTAAHSVASDFSSYWSLDMGKRASIVLSACAVIVIVFYIVVARPPANFPTTHLITIEEGATLKEIATDFQARGVVRSGALLKFIVLVSGGQKLVHAGDYAFKWPRNVFTIARAIETGAYGLQPLRFRVVEGATVTDMAELFAPQLERFDAIRFLSVGKPMEGFLYPDTYNFLPNTTDKMVIETLHDRFEQKIAEITPPIASSTHSLKDIVTMASILEREAHDTADRRMIAGILWKRISIGMPLQVDAAFLYTTGKNTFQLTTADLQKDSPYNTYTNKGLPPGPIGNPSLDSIEAALKPTKSAYLYYLADKNNVTHYAKTYEEHLQNKAKYLGT
jgi:UPF0755 protein